MQVIVVGKPCPSSDGRPAPGMKAGDEGTTKWVDLFSVPFFACALAEFFRDRYREGGCWGVSLAMFVGFDCALVAMRKV